MIWPKAMLASAIGCGVALAPVAAAGPVKAGADPNTAISPDGRWQAVIRQERGEGGASGSPPSSLWLVDRRTGRSSLLFRGKEASDRKQYTNSIAEPVFSLDGGFIYVEADAYATSPAIHQIDRRTGRERYVTDGGLIGVIRNGRWRGFLLVSQHRYHAGGGSYEAVSLFKPDGHRVMAISGTADGGEDIAAKWLRDNGWRLE